MNILLSFGDLESMKVSWSPCIIEDKDVILGYVDSDWNISICYDYSTSTKIEVLFHELIHWLIRNSEFSKLWDKLWTHYINLRHKAYKVLGVDFF